MLGEIWKLHSTKLVSIPRGFMMASPSFNCSAKHKFSFASLVSVPAQWNRDGTFLHTMEGDDDMPGHVKSSMMGVSLDIPIRNGRLALGTWQGIYLNEHRDQGGWGGGHKRNIIVTMNGQTA